EEAERQRGAGSGDRHAVGEERSGREGEADDDGEDDDGAHHGELLAGSRGGGVECFDPWTGIAGPSIGSGVARAPVRPTRSRIRTTTSVSTPPMITALIAQRTRSAPSPR